ncbi:MAG: amidohydrolase [Planctomycetota bacterium]|nr:MAG: amidohydrolase [Planctomycetota bacterium]
MSAFLLLLLQAPSAAGGPADLVLRNGMVHTMEAAQPRAQALAVRGGRIVFVGSSAEAAALVGEKTEIVDLRGRPLCPGFTDAHGHLGGLAAALRNVDLVGTRSYAEVIERVRARAAATPKGQWILGRGWDQNDWEVKKFPVHAELSAAVPDHPALLTRIDGHALLANARAMQAAGITRATVDPEGGRILRDGAGEPTGVFVDAAESLIARVVPEADAAALRESVRAAVALLHERGITGLHDAGVSAATLDLYAAMARAGELELREYVLLADDPRTLEAWFRRGPAQDLTGDGRIRVRAIKAYADGALGSRGAALLADYADDPGNRGLAQTSVEDLEGLAERALRGGFQLCTHAIGDAGNRMVLDAYAQALRTVPVADHRFRIEHAQVLAPEDIPRFAQLGVLPSMQAQHAVSDGPWAEARLGPERVQGAYAWRALLDRGVIIPGGSDFPVEAVDPIAAFAAAVTRNGWHTEQCMTREEALASLTIWPAYAAFQEDELGSIRVGKRADFVVLSEDLLNVPETRLGAVRVELTVFDGRVVHRLAAR